MIGVIADPGERDIASEFFELFKTPWQFYRQGRRYDVLISTSEGDLELGDTKLLVKYGGRLLASDCQAQVANQGRGTRTLSCMQNRIPIYGESIVFAGGQSVLHEQNKEEEEQGTRPFCRTFRVGYDLFAEVRKLLVEGQPVEYAAVPALELHIMLLRDLIIGSGITLFEIPPVPAGHQLIACLTHDVDHPSIRFHKMDHTMFGFIARAIVGSLRRLLQRQIDARGVLMNWMAAARLPFVYLEWARDCWDTFDEYLTLEAGLKSSFFVIPFKNRPGRLNGHSAPSKRASAYGISDIENHMRKLQSAGCEIALHGIDAWCDAASGRDELRQVRRISGTTKTGAAEIGVRMHWLYFDENSPALLEEAGATYDSTVGYNETIGYRAGTTQAYIPQSATRLVELPLHIMDTALFFPSHLNLSTSKAITEVDRMVMNACQFGGVITVNWHDRSIAPERLWGPVYVHLIEDLKRKGAWFASGSEAVGWFRRRRSAVFRCSEGAEAPSVEVNENSVIDLPDLQLRTHYGVGEHKDAAIRCNAPRPQCAPGP